MHREGNRGVPSTDQCYELLRRYEVPDNIIQHSEVVCKVAVLLAEALNEKGANLGISEIRAAALLHDMTKMEGLKADQDHAKTGNRLLAELGFARIGRIVAEHIKLKGGRRCGRISEEQIINYSDKRVMHTKVVALAERFDDLKQRYGLSGMDENAMQRIRALEDESYELERKIFAKLDFSPQELSDILRARTAAETDFQGER